MLALFAANERAAGFRETVALSLACTLSRMLQREPGMLPSTEISQEGRDGVA